MHESDLDSESPLPHVSQTLLQRNIVTLGDNNNEVATDTKVQAEKGNRPFRATYDQIADYLTDGYWEWSSAGRHGRFAFDVEPGGTLTVNVTALAAEGQQLARWAL